MLKNIIKKVTNIIKKCVNKIANSELIIIYTGIILFVKMCFFYEETIYCSGSIQTVIIERTFIFSMFLVTILFFLKNKTRFICSYILNLIVSVIMFADNVYYSYSSSLISVAQISNLQYSEQITTALGDLTKFVQFFYFVDLILILVMLVTKFIKLEKIKKLNWKPAILYTVIMGVVFGSTVQNYVSEASNYRYNKTKQLEAGTLYSFHFLDISSNINLKKTAKYKTTDEVLEAYDTLKEEYDTNYEEDIYDLYGIAEGKNVIVLQLESIQNFVIGKSINGEEITPNLNKFLSENIQFDNMIIQSYSTTADSEHTTMNSLYPLENGMAFAQYSGNSYDDIFGLYKSANYKTIYMHGNVGTFWNRQNVYRLLDVDEIDFIDSFDEDSELINGWLSDEALYTQAVQKLQESEEPFYLSILSASSHNGFDLPGLENKYDKVSIDVGEYKDTYFGNYLEAVNYADYAFGIFIEELKEAGLYDDTVIFIFGDHYGLQMYNEEMLDFLEKSDHEYNTVDTEINYVNVVCGIRIPGVEHMEITTTVSKLDIKPTLLYLCGIEDGVSLGENMFGTKDFACLNNGVIVTDDYYYNGNWYDRSTGEIIDVDNIDAEKKEKLDYYVKCMEEEISISNSIVLNDLLK